MCTLSPIFFYQFRFFGHIFWPLGAKHFNKKSIYGKQHMLRSIFYPKDVKMCDNFMSDIKVFLKTAKFIPKQPTKDDRGVSSNSLCPDCCKDLEEKADSLTQLMRNKGVCRTALAKQGLLKSPHKSSLFRHESNLWTNWVAADTPVSFRGWLGYAVSREGGLSKLL